MVLADVTPPQPPHMAPCQPHGDKSDYMIVKRDKSDYMIVKRDKSNYTIVH